MMEAEMAKVETIDNYVPLVLIDGRWVPVSPNMFGELNFEFPYRTEAEAWCALERFAQTKTLRVDEARVGRGWTKRLVH